MSRFDLEGCELDGEPVLNAEVKVGSFRVIEPKRYMLGERLFLTLEIEVDEKRGISTGVVDGVLTRRHNARVRRVAVVDESELLEETVRFWLTRSDDMEEPMIVQVGDEEVTTTELMEDEGKPLVEQLDEMLATEFEGDFPPADEEESDD